MRGAASELEEIAEIESWHSDFVIRLFVDKFALPPWLCGLLAFGFYWVVPLAFASWDGTLITIPSLNGYLGLFEGHKIIQWGLAVVAKAQNMGDGIPYLLDRAHFAFAILVGIAAAVGTVILRRMAVVPRELHGQDIRIVEPRHVLRNYHFYRKVANHWVGRVVSLILASGAFYFFYSLYQDPRLTYWWGSQAHGYAGLVLACDVFVMVYVGTQGIFAITTGSLMLARLFKNGIALRPYHYDGCNGLSTVGNLIFLLWIISIVLAGAIYVVMGLGYFGLERTQVAWILAVISIFAIPCVAITPLWAAMTAAVRAKQAELVKLEPKIHEVHLRTMASLDKSDRGNPLEWADHLSRLQAFHQLIEEVNIWPFNRHALAFVFSIYVIQTFLTLREIYSQVT